MQPTPTVAIVGRPNVGKSTLFNRLVGARRSIVHDQPGVTRDRLAARARLGDDTPVELVDTGGLLLAGDELGLNEQVELAIEESDLLLLVVDGVAGLLPADQVIWERLRPTGKPVVVVVNKGDAKAAVANLPEFYALGGAEPVLVSAEHGRGFDALHRAIAAVLPRHEPAPESADTAPRLAIVGRPNVGKSSLVNKILGSERVLVSPTAGTTRDPVDTRVGRDGREYVLIDTAGIRRRSRLADASEELAVMMARRQLERADLALLVIEAPAGVTSGDLGIGGAAWELGRGVVVAINKWDLLGAESRDRLEAGWPRLAEILGEPRRVNLSATSGRGVEKIFPAVETTLASYRLEVPTAELNRLLEGALERHQPPPVGGKPWRLYYATQVRSGPPTMALFVNEPLPRRAPYRRYLENSLRRELGLAGVPLRLAMRRRRPPRR